MVALPSECRFAGFNTFMVTYDGVAYQKDLSPNSLEIVKNMARYNLDKIWRTRDDKLAA